MPSATPESTIQKCSKVRPILAVPQDAMPGVHGLAYAHVSAKQRHGEAADHLATFDCVRPYEQP
jgi:hypothetical protein